MAKKKKSTGARKTLIALCVVLGIILVALVAGTVYAEFLLGKVNYIDPDATVPTLSQEEIDALYQPDETEFVEETEEAGTETVETEPVETEPVEIAPEETEPEFTLPTIEVNSDNVKTFLLVGKDTGSYRGTSGVARTDSMLLCSFNKEKGTITLLSFIRDLYVTIPGYQKNRINAAYSLGGLPLLQKTIETNFGIPIDGTVVIDFGNFKSLIDYVGGIDVELNSKEVAYINNYCLNKAKVGMNTLDGQQALHYARFRGTASGDLERTNRQRIVLSHMVNKYKNLGKAELLGVMDDVLPLVSTDMSKSDILGHFLNFFPMLADAELVSARIPVDGGYYLTKIDGMSVVVARKQQTQEAIAEIFGN